MKVVMKLSPEAIAWCRKQAVLSTQQHHNRTGCKIYNHNKVDSNIVGVKGEVAAYNYLVEKALNVPNHLEFVPKFTNVANQRNDPDILVMPYNIPIEVKSIRPNKWLELGRMIPPRHLGKYVRNNAIVIWTAAYPDDSEDKVDLHGWNYATEVRDHGIEKETICLNIWLKDPARVRPMETIFQHFSEPPKK